jgi:hypothetical protein
MVVPDRLTETEARKAERFKHENASGSRLGLNRHGTVHGDFSGRSVD